MSGVPRRACPLGTRVHRTTQKVLHGQLGLLPETLPPWPGLLTPSSALPTPVEDIPSSYTLSQKMVQDRKPLPHLPSTCPGLRSYSWTASSSTQPKPLAILRLVPHPPLSSLTQGRMCADRSGHRCRLLPSLLLAPLASWLPLSTSPSWQNKLAESRAGVNKQINPSGVGGHSDDHS